MFNETDLVDTIANATGYDTRLAEDSTVDLISIASPSPVRVYVGHLGIKLENPKDYLSDGYSEIDNPQILLTAVQFICARSSLAEVRTAIYDACTGFNPYPNYNYSSLSFVEGQIVAKTNSKIWFQDIWALSFPRIN